MATITEFMQPGVNVCERKSCQKIACGEFKRIAVEAKGWGLMPISLCSSHSAGRVPLTDLEVKAIMHKIKFDWFLKSA